MANVHVTEKYNFTSKPPVDREKNTISGVKLLGLTSRNGPTYQWENCSKRANLYEGAKVFCHHGKAEEDFPFGTIRSVEARSDGFYGTVHYNPYHPRTNEILWNVENSPAIFGMSPDHIVKREMNPKGQAIYTDIVGVNSVDLVSKPATTNGVFESMNPDGTVAQLQPSEGQGGEGEALESFKAQLAEVLKAGATSLPHDKFREVVKHLLNAHGALEAGDEEATESLKKELADTKLKLDVYIVRESEAKAKADAEAKRDEARATARKLCTEAGLPAYVITDRILENLSTRSAADMALDIVELKKITATPVRENKKPTSASPESGKPQNLDQFVKFLKTGAM